MKTENILGAIEILSSIEVIPSKNVQIKKVVSLKEMKELKSRLPFLRKAIMTGEKILYENYAYPFGQKIKTI